MALETLHDLHLETKPPRLIYCAKPTPWAYKITIYDALYIPVAEQVGYPLITADDLMVKKLKGHGIVVRLGDFEF